MERLRGLARLEPDLVVSTGDNLAARDAVPAVLDAYGDLLRRPGVFVLGSNDYWGPRPKNPARYLVLGLLLLVLVGTLLLWLPLARSGPGGAPFSTALSTRLCLVSRTRVRRILPS